MDYFIPYFKSMQSGNHIGHFPPPCMWQRPPDHAHRRRRSELSPLGSDMMVRSSPPLKYFIEKINSWI